MAKGNRGTSKNKGGSARRAVKNLRDLYNQSKKNRTPLKEQEVAQEGNVENLENDEYSTR